MIDPIIPGLWSRLQSSGFFVLDVQAGTATPSRLAAQMGYQSQDFLNGAFFAAIHPADRKTYDAMWARIDDGNEDELFVEYRLRTKSGGYRWVQTYGTVVSRLSNGKVGTYFGLDRDISARKQSEALLFNQYMDLERRYQMSESLRLASSVVTATLDLESTVSTILNQAKTLFPLTGARVWTYQDEDLECLSSADDAAPPRAEPATESLVLRVARERTPVIIDNLATMLPQVDFQASWIGVPLVFHGESRGVLEFWNHEPGYFRTEHVWPCLAFADNVAVGLFNARQFRQSREAGETDALTGLPTRRRLDRLGPQLFHEAVNNGQDLSVFMVDLDYFKQINDTFGHAQGDEVLRHFARTCQEVLRKGDLICRHGGDEFVALLPHTTLPDASLVAQRIIELFKSRSFPFDGRVVSLSLGMASLSGGGFTDLESLLHAADQALYRVKARGRDGFCSFESGTC